VHHKVGMEITTKHIIIIVVCVI